jgi:hypothetical protein
MKYIKTYEYWGYDKPIDDIREFFSNLKILSYYFEDYHKINDLFKEIGDEIGEKVPMCYFGVTNESESQFIPIVNTVTKHIHKIFDMIVKSDYKGIYDYCNNSNGYIYFERTRNGQLKGVSIDNHLSKEISNVLSYSDRIMKVYYSCKFNHSRWTDNKYETTKEKKNVIANVIEKNNLKNKYNISNYYDNSNEIRIISKNNIELNSEQLKEIEKAKEYGLEKYKYLKEIEPILKNSNKYNL